MSKEQDIPDEQLGKFPGLEDELETIPHIDPINFYNAGRRHGLSMKYTLNLLADLILFDFTNRQYLPDNLCENLTEMINSTMNSRLMNADQYNHAITSIMHAYDMRAREARQLNSIKERSSRSILIKASLAGLGLYTATRVVKKIKS